MKKRAASTMPNDTFTWTEGSSYGLNSLNDVYQTTNEGVYQGARLPEARGLSGLPDGLMTGEMPESLDISMTDDTFMDLEASGLVREAAALVDLQWLDPTQEPDPKRLPKEHKQGQAPLDLSEELSQAWGVNRRTDGVSLVANKGVLEATRTRRVSARQLEDSLTRAIRRAHFTKSGSLKPVVAELEAAVGQEHTQSVQAMLKAERGLLGNVYVLAAAFPDLSKVSKDIKKLGATYLVGGSEQEALKLGMYAVASVPWGEAYQVYASSLGLPSKVPQNPKKALQKALLTPVTQTTRIAEGKPVEVHAGDSVSSKDAFQALRKAKAKVSGGIAEDAAMRAASARLAKMVRVGHVLPEEATKLLKAAKSAVELDRLASAVALQGPSRRKQVFAETKVAAYQGDATAVFTGAKAPTSKVATIQTARAQGMVRFAREQMSEGAMGQDLDAVLEANYSAKELDDPKLASVRETHEGLSGSVYVDAAAYATTGLQGCEKGSAKHRANRIPTVLAMSKCATCVHAKQGMDGVSTCTLYNKVLVASAPVEDPASYKSENIRLANMPPEEVYAEMFNPGEYALQSEFGRSLSLRDEAPFEESLNIDTKGGWHL